MSKQDIKNTTKDWQLYENGKDYNRKLDLYNINDKNERFYSGDQWKGVKSNGLPTPVFNIFKQVINYFIAAIMSQAIKMNFSVDNIDDETSDENEKKLQEVAKDMSDYSQTLWERLKMSMVLRDGLLDGALSGDIGLYNYWDSEIETGQEAKGDIDVELVDGSNVLFGNPNNRVTKKQPYILIAGRELVSVLREEARANGVPEDKIKQIVSDTDNQEQSGDRGKIELDKDDENGKATYLIKLWKDKKTKKIFFNKSTKNVYIRKDVNTQLGNYPLAWTNWDKRKNSYHGQAIGTGLIPNQIFINKSFAMVMKHLMDTAFAKAIYDNSRIKEWSNQVGVAIGVNGDISGAATYLQPAQMASQIIEVIKLAIDLTKQLLGANDVVLGNIKPENTSAILAVQNQSSIPLENVKANLYQFVEDIGYIWLDFMLNKYNSPRKLSVKRKGKNKVITFDGSKYQDIKFNIKIDVGASAMWSEITSIQTLDNLLKGEIITFLQYLDRVPDGLIPKKQELIEELKEQLSKQDFMQKATYEQMAQFMETLPPDVRAQLQAMPPEEMEARVMEMMQGGEV